MSKPRTLIGLATPQANPTVELEFRDMFSGNVLAVITRLTSRAATPEARLRAYFGQLRKALESFDTLPMAAFGFACTGSSYLVGPDREDEATAELEAATGVPVITAAQAIRRELELRKARNIAVLAPYPLDLTGAAARYWARLEIGITAIERIALAGSDTREIYTLTPAAGKKALSRIVTDDADLVLASGTGMPTLDLVCRQPLPCPLLSSNTCLAAELLRRAGVWPADRPLDAKRLSGSNSR